MEDAIPHRSSFFAKYKISKKLFAACVILLTFLVFYLDIITGEKITFYIFYFPSIALIAWRLGKRAGWAMVALSTLLWIVAQWEIKVHEGFFVFFWNVVIRTVTFAAVCGLVLVIRDREMKLQEKSMELVRSNNELEQFAYRAAHDLNSPLATVFGFTELLAEKYQNSHDEETKECMDSILRSIRRMNAMIKALLGYATVTKKEKEIFPTNLEKLVEEVLENLRAEIIEKKAEITHSALPTVMINAGLAGVLFQNLIGNAIKYCEKNPRIHIAAVRKKSEWLFSIRDNGIGIPEKDRARVFLMFEKLPTNQEYSGSGIGLATCKKIVEHYNGRIWIESLPEEESVQESVANNAGGGSIVFFTLPASSEA